MRSLNRNNPVDYWQWLTSFNGEYIYKAATIVALISASHEVFLFSQYLASFKMELYQLSITLTISEIASILQNAFLTGR